MSKFDSVDSSIESAINFKMHELKNEIEMEKLRVIKHWTTPLIEELKFHQTGKELNCFVSIAAYSHKIASSLVRIRSNCYIKQYLTPRTPAVCETILTISF